MIATTGLWTGLLSTCSSSRWCSVACTSAPRRSPADVHPAPISPAAPTPAPSIRSTSTLSSGHTSTTCHRWWRSAAQSGFCSGSSLFTRRLSVILNISSSTSDIRRSAVQWIHVSIWMYDIYDNECIIYVIMDVWYIWGWMYDIYDIRCIIYMTMDGLIYMIMDVWYIWLFMYYI